MRSVMSESTCENRLGACHLSDGHGIEQKRQLNGEGDPHQFSICQTPPTARPCLHPSPGLPYSLPGSPWEIDCFVGIGNVL